MGRGLFNDQHILVCQDVIFEWLFYFPDSGSHIPSCNGTTDISHGQNPNGLMNEKQTQTSAG